MANLQQSKANRIKVINSFPTSGMGKEGDIMIANISGKGTYLCTKAGMRWYAADRLNELGRLKTPKLDDLTVTSLKVNNLSIKEKSTGAEIDLSKGDFTLDVDGDIELNADGGNLTFKDDSSPILSVSKGSLTLSNNSINTIFDVSGTGLLIDCSGNIELNVDGGQVYINDSIYRAFSFDCDTPAFTIFDDDNVSDYFRIRVSAEAETTISTFDRDSTVGHLLLQPDGDLKLDAASQKVIIPATDKLYFDGGTETYIVEEFNSGGGDILSIYVGGDKMLSLDESVDTGVTSLIGTLKIAEQTHASADTSGYGQLWVDTATPNELSFTDDAGTDIIGIGKYHYESKMANYTTVATGNFIPLSGGTVERTSTAGQNEYIAMVAPYNGTIEKILWRSEESQDGTMEMDIYESADETEVPGTITGTKDTVLDRENDDITFDVSFASMTSGVNTLTKGRIYAIKITTPSAPGDTNTTVVFKWDVTS